MNEYTNTRLDVKGRVTFRSKVKCNEVIANRLAVGWLTMAFNGEEGDREILRRVLVTILFSSEIPRLMLSAFEYQITGFREQIRFENILLKSDEVIPPTIIKVGHFVAYADATGTFLSSVRDENEATFIIDASRLSIFVHGPAVVSGRISLI